MRKYARAVPLFWLLIAGFVFAAVYADEPRPRAEDLGFSTERLNHIDDFYADEVQKGRMAGIVVLIARHGKIAHLSAIGYADTEKKTKMQPNALFRLYSMTKPIAATALMMLYEEGAFQLDDPISKYIPAFKGIKVLRTPDSPPTDVVPAAREPTIHDLFRHTAGLKHSTAAYDSAGLFKLDIPLKEEIDRLANLPLYYQPGTKWEYSVGQDVQARLVEIFSATSFEQFLQTRLFDPLGMKDTAYLVKEPRRLATAHWQKSGKLVPLDESHGHPDGHGPSRGWIDLNTYTMPRRQTPGSTGLVSTAEDYWRFAQMMLNGGEFLGKRFLSPKTIQFMWTDHLGPVLLPNETGGDSGIGWGLGFAVLKSPAAAGIMGSEGTAYWSGAAGTTFWIDPKNDVVVVAMTQLFNVPDTDIRGQMNAMVYGALIH